MKQWQLEKFEINKISKSFPYLVATDLAIQIQMIETPEQALMQSTTLRLLAKPCCKRAHCLEQCKVKTSLQNSREMSHCDKPENEFELTRP